MKRILAIFSFVLILLSSIVVSATSDAANQIYTIEVFKGEVVIHYTSAERTGAWKESSAVPNFDGGAHEWTNKKGDTLIYPVTGIQSGNYEVYAWVLPHKFNTPSMEYTIHHNGKQSDCSVFTQIEETETVAPGWVSMGVFDFSGDGKEKVAHVCPGGNSRASAIKLVPSKKECTTPQPEEPKTEKPDSQSQTESIDVEPAGECFYDGNWKFSTSARGPMTKAEPSIWIAAGETEATVTYSPLMSAVGDVRISVYMLYWKENQVEDVAYEVYHNGKKDTFHLNPASYSENQWVTLGAFDFAGKPEEEYVKLVTQPTANAKANTRASTVMFEVLNHATGGVWQTVYVTPINDGGASVSKKKLVQLNKFDDMKDHWAQYDVEYMANEKLVSGVADNLFDPEAKITRAEFVTILVRAMNYETVYGESYADVAQDSWYANYVATAKVNGLLNGLPTDDGFKPEQPITREEMALFTYNAIMQLNKNTEWLSDMPDDYAKFTDTDTVSDWAKTALQYLIQTSIIKGTSDTTVSAKDNATRAQGAVILKRFMQMFVWAGPPSEKEWVLTFNDEFNGTELDWGVWRSQAQGKGSILSSRWPENAVVKDGALYLENRKETRDDKNWTSGSVWIRPQVFCQRYGYFEARYKISAAPGINNSFWMSSGITTDSVKSVQRYELDINEGHYPNVVNTNYHSMNTGERIQYSEKYISEYDLSADYHTYAMEWNEKEMIYYFDGKVISRKENLNAHTKSAPYFSSAVIEWAGQVTDAIDGTAQVVDYVRIWQYPDLADDKVYTSVNPRLENVAPADEGPKVTTSDGVEAPSVKVPEQIVDNNTYDGEIVIPGTFEGNWQSSKAAPNYNNDVHYWTNTGGDKSTYALADVPAGKYKIYMWRIPHKNNIDQMDMLLTQDGKDVLAGSLALKLAEGETAEAGWILLGEHTLTGDKNASVNYTCIGTNCRVTAIKLVPVK